MPRTRRAQAPAATGRKQSGYVAWPHRPVRWIIAAPTLTLPFYTAASPPPCSPHERSEMREKNPGFRSAPSGLLPHQQQRLLAFRDAAPGGRVALLEAPDVAAGREHDQLPAVHAPGARREAG